MRLPKSSGTMPPGRNQEYEWVKDFGFQHSGAGVSVRVRSRQKAAFTGLNLVNRFWVYNRKSIGQNRHY